MTEQPVLTGHPVLTVQPVPIGQPVLTVDNLRVTIPRGGEVLEVLRGVSFEIADGESVGIVGESGSGKTMTVRSILRLLPRTATVDGEICWEGSSVLGMPQPALRRMRASEVGMVFQDPHAAINPVRTLGDFLTEGIRGRAARRKSREGAATILRRVGISDPERIMRLYPHQVSGGMLQRVMIGSVLMARPRLILADEPTTALDVTTQADVMALLTEVRQERAAAMVFITHDIELAASTCDRILVMYRGRIIESLTPQRLYAGDISEPYTRALLACRPSITERAKRLPVIDPREWEGRYA